MSLRYSCAMVGRQARSSLVPAARTSSLRPLAMGTTHISNNYNRIQMRLSSSNVPNLTPPWQFKDLNKVERKSFERWGPSYFEHLSEKEKALVQKVVERRTRLAAEFEEEFGSDWYAILQEASAIKDEGEHIEYQKMIDSKKYQQGDKETKRATRVKFYEDLDATKLERLNKLMQEVYKKRKNL